MLLNSGAHRVIRTKSGNYRTAGLCIDCAASYDRAALRRKFLTFTLGFLGLSSGVGSACYAWLVR
jgi:hypothetical protein